MLRSALARIAPIPASDERRILLERVHDAHCLLEVRCGSRIAQSVIVELLPARASFVLDGFKPALDDALLARTPTLVLRTRLDGLELRFETRVIERGGPDHAPYYRAAWPESIDYPQRRREFRAVVPLDRDVGVVFGTARGAPARGQLRDLSPSGFSLDLATAECKRLALTDGWRGSCQIELGDLGPLAASIEVCHVRTTAGVAPARIGVCFVDMDARSERCIERYVAALERARARLR